MSEYTQQITEHIRVRINVLSNGSIKVSLEQRLNDSIASRSWQPVCFRTTIRKNNRNGYIVKPPGFIGRLLGDTLEKRVRRCIMKCRRIVAQSVASRKIVERIVPHSNDITEIARMMELFCNRIKNNVEGFFHYRNLNREEMSTLQDVLNSFENIMIELLVTRVLQTNSSAPHEGASTLSPDTYNVNTATLLALLNPAPPETPQETPDPPPVEEESPPYRMDDLIFEGDKSEEQSD